MLGSLFGFCSIYVPLFSLGFQKLLQEVIEGVGKCGARCARAWRGRGGGRWRGGPSTPAGAWGVGGGTCSGATRGER